MNTETPEERIAALTAALDSILNILGTTPLTRVIDTPSADLPGVAHQARREIAQLHHYIAALKAHPPVILATGTVSI